MNSRPGFLTFYASFRGNSRALVSRHLQTQFLKFSSWSRTSVLKISFSALCWLIIRKCSSRWRPRQLVRFYLPLFCQFVAFIARVSSNLCRIVGSALVCCCIDNYLLVAFLDYRYTSYRSLTLLLVGVSAMFCASFHTVRTLYRQHRVPPPGLCSGGRQSSRMTAHQPRVSLAQFNIDRRLLFCTGGSYIFKSRQQHSPYPALTALLILIGGVEMNPGPAAKLNHKSASFTTMSSGYLNCRSAAGKIALIHDLINDSKFRRRLKSHLFQSSFPTA